MAMEINSVYGNYAGAYTNQKETKQVKDSKSANEVKKIESAQQSSQDYLKTLKEKYPDVNITVGKGTTAKSFKSYMLGSSGANNIYIEDNIIQKMASDPAYAAKYEKVIADAPKAGKEIKESLESMGHRCLASGTQIDEKGRVSYWCVGYNPNAAKHNAEIRAERQKSEKNIKDSIDKSRQNRKEQAESIKEKQAELRAEEKERMELLISKADSVEGMVSKVGKGETEVLSGKMLDGIKSVGVDLRA